jgi:two-component system alkaline phosphatase synthesis response regulator PhoP
MKKEIFDIAILDHTGNLSNLLSKLISNTGRRIFHFRTAGRFIESLTKRVPHVLLLNIELPDLNGKDLIMILRKNSRTSNMLIVGFSDEKKSVSDIVTGLDAGADEYIIMPFSSLDIKTRLDSLFKRHMEKRSLKDRPEISKIKIGDLEIEPDSRVVKLAQKNINLSILEYELLLYFLKNSNRVVSRNTLICNIWKKDIGVHLRVVDKRIEVLRSKLGVFGRKIETVFGIGYIFRL